MPEPQNQIGSIRVKKANWNLPAPILFERRRVGGEREGSPSADRSWSPPASNTGRRRKRQNTIVRNAVTDKSVWVGEGQQPFAQEKFGSGCSKR